MSDAAYGFDTGHLADYLQRHIEGFRGPVAAHKFPSGQSNPTFQLTTPDKKYVLRRKPPGTLLKSAHAVDREYRVLAALADSDVPVAEAYHLCLDEAVIGGWFYVMEYKTGRIFWDPALPEMNCEERGQVYDEMNRILAAIHSVDIEAAGLIDFGKPGNYYARQTATWVKQYRASETGTIDAMEALIAWLPQNLPRDDGLVSLIHGDYRLDNLMFHAEKPEIIAVFDWELSTLGHPIADLAYQCMQWSFGREWQVKGLAGCNLPVLNIPTQADYTAAYCRRRGIMRIDHWSFYLAFSFFRLAGICQGVMKRALDGNASSERALTVGRMTSAIAELGVRAIESPLSKRQ